MKFLDDSFIFPREKNSKMGTSTKSEETEEETHKSTPGRSTSLNQIMIVLEQAKRDATMDTSAIGMFLNHNKLKKALATVSFREKYEEKTKSQIPTSSDGETDEEFFCDSETERSLNIDDAKEIGVELDSFNTFSSLDLKDYFTNPSNEDVRFLTVLVNGKKKWSENQHCVGCSKKKKDTYQAIGP